MRWLRNIIVLLLLIIFVVGVYIKFSSLFSLTVKSEATDLNSSQFKDASIKISYILSDKKWLSYVLQSGEDRVRVMSNALLNIQYQINEDERILYSIIYEVLDDDGVVIRSSKFYHRTGQKIYVDQESGQRYVSTSIYPREENPVDSRIHLINLRGLKNASKIRFKIGENTYPIKKIVLRAYQKKNISERKLQYSWQRMGEEQRQKLAKVSVYDASIINQQEQHELLKNQWAPMGPLGVDDEDYFIQKLYVTREVENDVVVNAPAVPSTGLVIYPGRYGVVTLPENFKQLKISWSLFDSTSKQKAGDRVSVEWWGHPATRYKKWNSVISKGEIKLSASSGIIRISSDQPIVIRVWQTTKTSLATDKTFEITPAPAYLRLYSAQSSGLVYKVNHIAGYKTPFRFDLRALDASPSSDINYRLLDKDNHQIKAGKFVIPHQMSVYDGVVAKPRHWLTEPLRVYFNLPRRVSKIVFKAPEGVWISAYSRPKNLAYKQMHPANKFLIKGKLAQSKRAVPVWFGVRPENWKEYMRKSRSQLITVQRRPPEIDPQLLAGQYKWHQFYPAGDWKGRYLLNEVDKNQPFRVESLGTRFVKIQRSEKTKLNFLAKNATDLLRPTLIYSQTQKREMIIRVWLNERMLFEKKVFDKNGELQLPYIKSGVNALRIESEFLKNIPTESSSNVSFYINNAISQHDESQPEEKPVSMLKRVLIEMPSKTLSFRVKKEKPQELLALRIYTRQPMSETIKIRVKINGMDGRKLGPFDDWTLMHREYELNQFDVNDANIEFPVILNTDHNVSTERLFFIPLGSDMPVQKNYTIDVKVQQDAEAYMVLTRSTPGLYPSRKIYPDVEIETDNE